MLGGTTMILMTARTSAGSQASKIVLSCHLLALT